MKKLIYIIIILIALVLSSCFRESDRFPAGVDPFSLIESEVPGYYIDSVISEEMNYYIPSQNDDSYLLIEQEAIADTILIRDDYIWFGTVDSFTSRDSIFISNHFTPISETYFVGVYRDSVLIHSDTRVFKHYVEAFISISKIPTNLQIVSWGEEYLEPIEFENINNNARYLSFNLNKSIEFTIYDKVDTDNDLLIPYTGAAKFILSDDFKAYIPANLSEDDIIYRPSIPPSSIQQLYSLYDNIYIHPYSFSIDFGTITFGDEFATFEFKSIDVNPPDLLILNSQGFPQSFDIDSDYWESNQDSFIAYPNKSGDYLFVLQDDTQSIHRIPLDGSFTSVLVDNVFIDLNDINIPDTSLEIYSDNTLTGWDQYFGATSFNLDVPTSIYHFRLVNGDLTISELPEDEYIEIGVPANLQADYLFYHQDLVDPSILTISQK